jgi:hypothetical protein
MSEEVIKILDDLAQRFGIAINWADKNVVPYLQELFDKFINWEIWTSVMYGGIGLIFMIIGIILAVIAGRIHKKNNVNAGDAAFDYLICTGIPFVIGATCIFTQLYDIIECLTFPEKTLFDYVTYQMDNN